MTLFQPPPPERYAQSSLYGFYLQEEGSQVPVERLVAPDDYVALVLNPQSVRFSEPFATSVAFTQGGGKFRESRGQIVKMASISGTTGFLPTPSTASQVRIPTASVTAVRSLVDESFSAEQSRAQRSGFKAFHDLRQIFRKYGAQLREGKLPSLFYFDTKNDEFWEIEPVSFDWDQTSRRPVMYGYSIQFTCIEVTQDPDSASFDDFTSLIASAMVDVPGAAAQVEAAMTTPKNLKGVSFGGNLGNLFKSILAGKPPYAATIRRYSEMAQNGLGFLKFCTGVARGLFQNVLSILGSVVQVFDDVASTERAIADVPVSILRQLSNAIAGAYFVVGEQNPSGLTEEVRLEWNEFLVEIQGLNDQMICGFDRFGDSYANRSATTLRTMARTSTNGSAFDLMEETGTPLAVNPFIGALGVDAVVDVQKLLSSDGFRSVAVLGGETIYDVARRTLGNVHRFVELVIVNELSHPFIVPSRSSKPPGTIAWGEYIKVPTQTNGRSGAAVGPPEVPLSAFAGVVASTGTSVQVVSAPSDPPWRVDQWVGYTITLTSGLGAVDGQRVVVANTVDTLVVNLPWTVSPAIGDTFSIALQEFHLNVPPSPEALAYGRDFLLQFNKNPNGTANPYKATVVLDSTGDFAEVSGSANFQQAMLLLFSTSKGQHPFHAGYGFPLPIGRPFTDELGPLYTFFSRQALLQDPRVESVTKPQLALEGGVFSFEAEVKPVNAHKSKQLALGGQ